MKAVSYTAFGAASDVLEICDVPTPDPSAGEVLVRVSLSGVNPSDVKARVGNRPGVTKPPFPRIVPHSDGVGVIEAVGEGVDNSRVGQRVWLWNGQWQRAFGTCAEYIALSAAQAVPMPEGVSDEIGAVMGIPGLTAAYTVLGAGPVAGKTVLVSGGAGMVGHLAVQIAKASGAKVIATASPAKHAIVRDCGADAVIDYKAPDLAARIIAANGGKMVDHAVELEFGLNINMLSEVLAPHSRIMAYGSALAPVAEVPFMTLMFKMITLEAALVYILTPEQRAKAVDDVNRLQEAGQINPRIAPLFEVADAAKAHEAVEQNSRDGAVLIKMG